MNTFHLSVAVKNFKDTVAFYCTLLGGAIEKNDPARWGNINLDAAQVREAIKFYTTPEERNNTPHG